MVAIQVCSSQFSLSFKQQGKKLLLFMPANLLNEETDNFLIIDSLVFDNIKTRVFLEKSQKLYIHYLDEIAKKMNVLFNEEKSIKYWETILGKWIFDFIIIFLSRWQIVENAVKQYDNLFYLYINKDMKDLICKDFIDFNNQIYSDEWNEIVFQTIIKNFKQIKLKEIQTDLQSITKKNSQINIKSKNRRIKFSTINGLIVLLKIFQGLGFSRFNRFSIHGDYFDFWTKFKMQIFLREFPTYSNRKPVNTHPINFNLRTSEVKPYSKDKLNEVLSKVIMSTMPIAYLEGYKKNTSFNFYEWMFFPRKPRIIFTANSFSADDRWKFWAAKTRENGSKVVIAQHGGHYGLAPFCQFEFIEKRLSDYYFNWGWESNPKSIRVPATKLIRLGIESKKIRQKNKKIITIILMSIPRFDPYIVAGVTSYDYLNYLSDIKLIISSLRVPKEYKLIIRGSREDFGWGVEEFFSDIDAFYDKNSNFANLINDSSLVISTYNATTFIESMTLNIPTLMYLKDELWPLDSKYQGVLDRLKHSRILVQQSVELQSEIMDLTFNNNVHTWWNDPSTQHAKELFLEQFGYIGPRPYKEFSKIISKL